MRRTHGARGEVAVSSYPLAWGFLKDQHPTTALTGSVCCREGCVTATYHHHVIALCHITSASLWYTLIEEVKAMINAEEIARSAPRIEALIVACAAVLDTG